MDIHDNDNSQIFVVLSEKGGMVRAEGSFSSKAIATVFKKTLERGNEFAPNGVIKTTLGRLSNDNRSVIQRVERDYCCEFAQRLDGKYYASFCSPALAAEVQVVLEKAGFDAAVGDGARGAVFVKINGLEPDELP